MPRQKKEKQEKRIKVLPPCRVSETEKRSIYAKAEKSGMNFSEYQRHSLLDSVIVVRENVLEAKAVSQLSSIGNNLNQLVRKTHIHDEADTKKMREILETIDSVVMGLIRGS